MMVRVVIPIPLQDSDPSEVAVTWEVLSKEGHEVVFATPDGAPGTSDELMITGKGLDFWSGIPVVKHLAAIGFILRANEEARRAYKALISRPEFVNPIKWEEIDASSYDALVLPGGHRARGMREYLESPILQGRVVEFFGANKPVGAICHGVLLVARSESPATGKSVLFGRKTTALTWNLENAAWSIAKWSRFWDPNYYRAYLEEPGQLAGYMYSFQNLCITIPSSRAGRSAWKHPGRTWIEVNNEVHSFTIEDCRHPQIAKIRAELKRLSEKMEEEGYVSDTRSLLHFVDDENRDVYLCNHGEKLAIAFGLISTPPGTPLYIFKNLGACPNCHSATKFIAKIVGREIIVRDSNRFHHFRNGYFSCKD